MPRLLTNDPVKVVEATGFDSWHHCLPPKLGIDQFRTALPLLITDGNDAVLVAKEIDRTNLEAIDKPGVRFAFHTPYFSFDRYERASDAYQTLPDAVADLAGTAVELDPDLPVGLHAELTERLGIPPVATEFPAPMNHYRVPRATVAAQAAWGRDAVTAAAEEYLSVMPAQAQIRDWLTRPTGDVLASLDELMAREGIEAILASSPLNVQELTGVPATLLADGTWAVYLREAPDVHVLARRELPWLGLPEAAPADRGLVPGLVDGASLGYEELDLSRRAFAGFCLDDIVTRPASLVLRRWRELRTVDDAAYYLIGAQITRAGIDTAISVAEQGMASGDNTTELQAYERYRGSIAADVAKLPIRVRTYFTHTHTGDRSHIPALATAHRIHRRTSLKIDAGLEIYDEHGYLRAVSDITRTAVCTEASREFYDLLGRILTEHVIASCRPGRTGHEVFTAGMSELDRDRSWLVDSGFCPPSDLPLTEMFGRDIGHLLGKQEPATVVLEKGCTTRLEPGMAAAAELQWPYHDYCVGVEDIFLVTEDEPVNLTRVV
ncbi:MAG: M24 family metallopeptidase [Propionibacteriales bacterium]|nr:M24 family metallopeptidase [Propionibacteriales bacterium]